MFVALFDGDEAMVTWGSRAWDEACLEELVARVERAACGLGCVHRLEWKIRAHDAPPRLAGLLAERGYVADLPEAVMLGGIDEVLAVLAGGGAGVPLRVRRISAGPDAASDVAAFVRVQGGAFGVDPGPEKEAEYLRVLDAQDAAPDTGLWLAEVWSDEAGEDAWLPVGCGRMVRVPGTRIVGVWGGGVLPSARGMGVYRALLAARLEVARAAGARWVHSDSSPMSAPIHARLGMVRVSEVRPMILEGEAALRLSR